MSKADNAQYIFHFEIYRVAAKRRGSTRPAGYKEERQISRAGRIINPVGFYGRRKVAACSCTRGENTIQRGFYSMAITATAWLSQHGYVLCYRVNSLRRWQVSAASVVDGRFLTRLTSAPTLFRCTQKKQRKKLASCVYARQTRAAQTPTRKTTQEE